MLERFAYGVFLRRPTRSRSASLEFERDGVAAMKMSIHCKTRQDWIDALDVRQLAAWIAAGATEEPLAWPAVG